MAEEKKKPEEETPAETTPAEDTPPAEEKPAEDTPPAEDNPPTEEEKTTEEEEKPAEDEEKALADTIASAVQEAVTVALADANAEIATLKAKLEAAELRAQKAEGTLRGITAARGKPLQLPTAPAASTASNDAKAQWQKAVREHGLQAAMKKFPDLLAAVRSAAK